VIIASGGGELDMVGPGRSATAESSVCQLPVRPKNVLTESPLLGFSYRLSFLGLPGSIGRLGAAYATLGIANRSV